MPGARGCVKLTDCLDRQSAHIASVIPRARAAGFTHILHVDDDELIYCATGVGALLAEIANAPESRPDLHMQNVEAVFPSDCCANPFREVRIPPLPSP